jgi:hypothetical protein
LLFNGTRYGAARLSFTGPTLSILASISVVLTDLVTCLLLSDFTADAAPHRKTIDWGIGTLVSLTVYILLGGSATNGLDKRTCLVHALVLIWNHERDKDENTRNFCCRMIWVHENIPATSKVEVREREGRKGAIVTVSADWRWEKDPKETIEQTLHATLCI